MIDDGNFHHGVSVYVYIYNPMVGQVEVFIIHNSFERDEFQVVRGIILPACNLSFFMQDVELTTIWF